MLVARQGDGSRKLNQAFLMVDSWFNFNFGDEERSDIYDNIGLCFCQYETIGLSFYQYENIGLFLPVWKYRYVFASLEI